MRLLSYNRSSERGGTMLSHDYGGFGSAGVRTRKRDYDSAPDDDDVPLTGSMPRRSGEDFPGKNLRYSSDSQAESDNKPTRSAATTKSYHEAKARDRGMEQPYQEAKARDRGIERAKNFPLGDHGRPADRTESFDVGDDGAHSSDRLDQGGSRHGRVLMTGPGGHNEDAGERQYNRRGEASHQRMKSADSSGIDAPRKSLGASTSSSKHRYSDDHDDDHDDDVQVERGEYGGSRTFDSGTGGSGSAFGLDSTQSVDDATVSNFDGTTAIDFNQTVNTDVSMPGDDVGKQADAYEREVARVEEDDYLGDDIDRGGRHGGNRGGSGLPLATPPGNRGKHLGGTGGTQSSKVSAPGSVDTASPFDNIASDFDDDDGSLDLSQSADNFTRMMSS